MRNKLANDIIDFLVYVLPDLNENLFFKFIKHFVDDKNVNKTQLRCLLYINNYGVESMSELCSKLNVEKGSITSMIDDLTRKGYVRRERDTNDKRKYSLIITDEGKALSEDFLREYKGYLQKEMEKLTDNQGKDIQESIRKMKKLIK